MIIKERGITEEVYTMYSGMKTGDIINQIGDVKCEATLNWVESLDVNIDRTVIVGAYITGMKLAERFKEFSKVTVIDIHPHLESLLGDGVHFTDDLTRISDADLVIDTTGLGGLSPESVREFVNSDVSLFLVEDPTSDGSDNSIMEKSNITERVELASSRHKGILKTGGLNTKTSGTMTMTIEILRNSLHDLLKSKGVLYGVAGMNFYEGVLFKEKDYLKFTKLMTEPAMIISALQPISPDDALEEYLQKIDSVVADVSI
ncbi:SAM-dependent methyltransferase HcgC family protein [uncultured Methanobacterium sp.]|uniref:SAM-dependent methyltransferase HcgC family protein n=1 Tax=uncultured Methanobacterium sp. TaxID=176306 RepID=UPI002AA91C79|nr:SAM-dependent methyltransferase HcgC family protein [uncultured Methanobacterium sp.]